MQSKMNKYAWRGMDSGINTKSWSSGYIITPESLDKLKAAKKTEPNGFEWETDAARIIKETNEYVWNGERRDYYKDMLEKFTSQEGAE